MKLTVTLILLFAATAASAAPFPTGDAATGQTLFDRYQCNRCHEKIVGGDGNAIFTRKNRKARTPAELLETMDIGAEDSGITLSAMEKQHLGAYLNRYYHFE